MALNITHDHLSIETDPEDTACYRVVAWSMDGFPCTIDSGLSYDEANGLRNTLKTVIETWG